MPGTFTSNSSRSCPKLLRIQNKFVLAHLGKQQQLDLMDIMEDRHGRSSTIITSQLPVANWYDVFGEGTIADAVLDGLVHTSYRIDFQ
jgi:DNA replication protein DnaC